MRLPRARQTAQPRARRQVASSAAGAELPCGPRHLPQRTSPPAPFRCPGDDANLYAELLDVAPDGTTTLVNGGFLRASHRSSHTDPSPVTPGEATTFTTAVRADHHRFPAGHRIALRLSGGAPEALTPNPTPVDVTVTTGGASTLTLPHLTGL